MGSEGAEVSWVLGWVVGVLKLVEYGVGSGGAEVSWVVGVLKLVE